MARNTHARGLAKRTLRDAAETLKILAHPTRLKLIELLTKADYTVNELADTVGEAQNAVSQHLKLMQRAGILTRHRDGRSVYYRIRHANRLPLLVLDAIRRQNAAAHTFSGGEAI